MEEGNAKLTLSKSVGDREVVQTLTLSPEDYPHLVMLLRGPDAKEVHDEIARLVGTFWHARAERLQMQVFAKLVVFGDQDGADEESVIVQDISSSGIRVAVPRDASLDLKSLTHAHFLLAVREGDERRRLNLAAEFIRVADVDENQISLAFRFNSIDPEEARLLERGPEIFKD